MNKKLTGLYVDTEKWLRCFCEAGDLLEKICDRLIKESKEPEFPLPALSSACSYVLKRGKINHRVKAHFTALKNIGQIARTRGVEHAIESYLSCFRRQLRGHAS